MFCPKCGQQQSTEGMRFCSRCGFTLGGVSHLLESNGAPPEPPATTRNPICRNRMMVESAAVTAFGWTVALLTTFWFNAHGIYEGIAHLAASVFGLIGFIGLGRFLYAFLFFKDSARPALPPVAVEHSLARETSYAGLPPAQTIPISDYPLRVNTKEMRPQASVTENTTRLLDE
jgi:hypothetical protein